MSKLKFPIAINRSRGCLVPVEEAKPGNQYYCPFCRRARLMVVNREGYRKHFRTVPGDYHTCMVSQGGAQIQDIEVIDVKRIARSCLQPRTQHQPAQEMVPHPRMPRSPAEKLTLCRGLSDIYKYQLHKVANFMISDSEQLINHFVSFHNAFMVMGNNVSFGYRILEVQPYSVLRKQRGFQFILKAHKNQNNARTAARLVINLISENDTVFYDICNLLFISDNSQNYPKYFARYDRALIVANFTSVDTPGCRTNNPCGGRCQTQYTHCIGLQTARLITPRQILPDESAKIDMTMNHNI